MRLIRKIKARRRLNKKRKIEAERRELHRKNMFAIMDSYSAMMGR